MEIPLWAQLGIAAVFLAMLVKLYTDGKAERKYMMDLLEKAYLMIAELKGDDPDDHDKTLMQRPGS